MAKYEIKLEHLCEVVGYVTAPIPIGGVIETNDGALIHTYYMASLT